MPKYGMAIDKQTESSSEVTSKTDFIHINSNGGTEISHLPITGHKLNGNNYLQWSQSVMMYVCGRGKDEFLTSDIIPLEADNPKYRSWKAENNILMSWLINSD